MISNRHIMYSIAAAVSAAFLVSIPDIWKVMEKTVNRQIAANERLVEWKQAYEALLPVNTAWKAAFNDAGEAKDLLAIYKMIDFERHGLRANVDLLRQAGMEDVLVNGAPVALQKVCVGVGSDSIELTANSMMQLRAGVRSLSKRVDLDLGSIEYEYKAGVEVGEYVARVTPFCVKVRTDATEGGRDVGQ